MKKLLHPLTFCLLFCYINAWSQGELPVNMFTGSPIVTVGIHTIASDGVSESVSLNYDASGVKVDAAQGKYGVNWSINSSSISREIRGIPDDFYRATFPIRYGWLYLNGSGVTTAADIATVPNTADTNAGLPCSDETADFNKLYSFGSLSPMSDPEPDIFSYNVGGYAGKFVFDNGSTPQIRLIPYQDISIVPTFVSPTDKRITAFTITTNTGMVYSFTTADTESRWTETIATYNEAFRIERDFYYSTITPPQTVTTYNTAWHLAKATSPSGGELTYIYQADGESKDDTVSLKIKKRNSSDYQKEKVYINHLGTYKHYLHHILSSAGPSIYFNQTNGIVTNIEIKDFRDGDESTATSSLIKQFKLQYTTNSKKQLLSIQEIAPGDTLQPYKFQYWGSAPNTSNAEDFWGYYNGKTANTDLFPTLYVYPALTAHDRFRIYPIAGYAGIYYTLDGADRTVDAYLVKQGSLYSLSYPWGGSTTIEYEPNQYYDAVANQSFYGGGIRIKSVSYMDGTNPDAKIEKSFTYLDAQGRSSGVLVTQLTFAVPLWEHRSTLGDLPFIADEGDFDWKLFTARTDKDISSNSSQIGYKEVKVFRPKAGYAHFEYELPAGWRSAATGDWSPTVNKIARNTNCPPSNPIEFWGTGWMYPYSPDPEFDYERGLLAYKREYDSAGHKVRETHTTYQYLYKAGTTPLKVWGVKYERYPNADENIYLFGKYFLLTDVAKVVAQEIVTTYDANDVAKNATGSAEYIYGSSAHKLLTRVKNTSPDGAVYQTYLKYPLDYGTVPGNATGMALMIGTMQTNRNGIPIEQHVTSQTGAVEKVVGGSITTFHDFSNPGKILPQTQLAWRSATAVDVGPFVESYINGSGLFTTDAGYEVVNTFLAYDSLDKLSHSIGEDKVPVTTVWSSKISAPVTSVVNAAPGQFAVSDFEVTTEASFAVYDNSIDEAGIFKGPGRSGKWGLYPEVDMVKTINKASDNYWVTGWWNKYITSFLVHVVIKDQTNTTIYFDQTFTVNASAHTSAWDFFKLKIPLTGVPSTFNVILNFSGSGTPTPGVSALIDDFAFYPENATLSTVTYQFPFGATSSTSGDKTGFTVYDNLGRVKYVLDRDKNIVQKNTYTFTTN